MNAEHLDDDELVTLCGALCWAPDAWLAHLAGCPRCRSTLRQSATLHGAFAAEVPPSLLAAVQKAVAAAARGQGAPPAPPERQRAPRRVWLSHLGAGLLAGSTAFAGLLAFGMVNPLTAGVLAPTAVLAIGVGLATACPDLGRRVLGRVAL